MISYDGNVITYNDRWIEVNSLPPIQPYSIRLLYKDGVTPTFSNGTVTQVSSSPNIWDLTYENNNWAGLISNQTNLLEVLSANTTNVINMNVMFFGCESLVFVSLFDTSNVTNMSGMFLGCRSLTTIPLFNTSIVINMDLMFNGCTNVESGALALYQQASSQDNPPNNHTNTFTQCGIDTITGSAELSQIPSSWGGTGA